MGFVAGNAVPAVAKAASSERLDDRLGGGPLDGSSRDYLARTLPVFLWLTLLGSFAAAALAFLSMQLATAAGLLANVALIGAALVLTHLGRLRLASALFIGDGLLLITYLLWVGEGLRDVAVLVYPVILIVGGMLLDGASFGALLALCLGSLLLVAIGRGSDAARTPASLASDVLYITIMLAVTAAAVRLLASALWRSLREARTSERAQRASEASFTKAFRSTPVIMAITALDDARILDVNDAFAAATGFARAEVVGATADDFPLFVDAGEAEAIRAAMREHGAVRGVPLRLRSRSGAVLSTLVNGEEVELDGRRCALYAATDISDRKRAEDALAVSEERYRLISEVSSDYTFSNRVGGDGKLQLEWVAGAFERITGYSFDEYVARGGWPAMLHPADAERDAEAFKEICANRPVVSEVRIVQRSGALRWVRVYAHPVWNEAEQRLAGIHGAVQDVSEEREAAAEREALLRELEAKNAELERFSYTVSHDLKSPLITVQSFIGFLEQDAASGNLERLRSDVARIGAATAKMQRMLSELLELSRIGRVAGELGEVPLLDVAQEAVGLVRGRIEASGVRVELSPELPLVRGDRVRLQLALQNLLDNAVKFMGRQAQPRVEIGVRREQDGTVFFVRDNGSGIDPRHHEKVFGLFEKLDAGSEGTGLGLALVRRVIETHQGAIWVESAGKGHGSTFCFTLGVGRPGAPASRSPG